MSDVTRILSAIDQGDTQAAEQLLPLVYVELRKLAAQKLAQEKPGQTLQATALVHEAYLRLIGPVVTNGHAPNGANAVGSGWNSRRHFFAAAAEAMRRILVERARHHRRLRHGGGRQRVHLDGLDVTAADTEQFLALNEALEILAVEDPQVAQVVNLRYFAGLTGEQIAGALGISARTVKRHWAYARARLAQLLGHDDRSAD